MSYQVDLGRYARDESYKQTKQETHIDIQREIIHRVIISHPEGITDLEICNLTGISRSSVNARRNELENVVGVGLTRIDDRLNTMWGVEW